jgi:hypothetical protein
MKTPLCGLLLASLLLAPAAEARSGGGRAAVATAPFPTTTIGIARQAAALSRLRARQAAADRITASQGAIGTSGVFAGTRLAGTSLRGVGSPLGAIRERERPVSRMHVITVRPAEIAPGEIQIIRGISVETVRIR